MNLPDFADESPFSRWHIAARARCLPYDLLDRYVVEAGDVLDWGCGYGLASFHLANERRTVLGYDIDERRIAAANRYARPPALRFTADPTVVAAQRYDQVVMLDVLYLLSPERHDDLFAHFRSLLRDGGRLLFKETLRTRSLPYYFVVAEERVLKFLGRTRGATVCFHPDEYYRDLAARHDLPVIETVRRHSAINVYQAYLCEAR